MSKFKKVQESLFRDTIVQSFLGTIERLIIYSDPPFMCTEYNTQMNRRLSPICIWNSKDVHSRNKGLRMSYFQNNSRLT